MSLIWSQIMRKNIYSTKPLNDILQKETQYKTAAAKKLQKEIKRSQLYLKKGEKLKDL